MHILFVIDPLEMLNLATETSLLLIEELARRGHVSSVATIHGLSLTEHGAAAQARSIELDLTRQPFYDLGPQTSGGFERFDLVLMRKDPPVDEAYIFATHVLERATADTLVLNNPVSLRLLNEKLLPLRFPQWTPPTLVSADAEQLDAFSRAHGRIVLKPLSECSGRGIRLIDANDAASAITKALAARNGSPLLAQKFLPGVAHGDKRVIVVDGKPIGAVNRIPRSADHLANIHQGAEVRRTDISDHESNVIAHVGRVLQQYGLYFAGLDFIDGYLTEINITSPSAVRQINQMSAVHLEVTMVDFLERFVSTAGKDERVHAID
ncbi:MAG TPA: glutathione synthase [Candidatus Acidoferrales bacterium]|nr:glutathione synthase [Candidatus Acidoferrales bacterium]